MEESRYEELNAYNQQILAATPAAQYLWNRTAIEIESHYKPGSFMLEVGPGEGDSTLAVLRRPFAASLIPAKLRLLDLSQDMIERGRAALHEHEGKVLYACADANKYLQGKTEQPYGLIYSCWTVHNFPWHYKLEFFEAVYEALEPDGTFVLMDKVYPNDRAEANRLFSIQADRYGRMLPPSIYQKIFTHEREDLEPEFRMDEADLIRALALNFRRVIPVDRVEREMIIICKK